MHLGQKLLDLRKKSNLTQEEVADKLGVSRQTVSKWETDMSTPDLDKLIPICKLYGITTEELLSDEKIDKDNVSKEVHEDNTNKRALGIGLGVLMFFLSVIWIMISIQVFKMNPIVASSIFLLFIAVGVCIIVYTGIVYKKDRKKEKIKNPIFKQIDEVLGLITLVIYLGLSFLTGAWHITWLIWIIYALVMEIIKLIFVLRGEEIDEE